MTKKSSNLLTKKRLKSHLTVNNILILSSTLIACYIPFLHIHFEKGQDLEIFGWANPRLFLYSVGKPVCMLYFAIYIFVRNYYKSKQTIDLIASLLLMVISFFFITWAVYPPSDLPRTAYNAISLIISLSSTYMVFLIVKHIHKIQSETLDISKKLFKLIISTIKKLPQENSDQLVRDLHKTIEK